jgi:hypothetical protein
MCVFDYIVSACTPQKVVPEILEVLLETVA